MVGVCVDVAVVQEMCVGPGLGCPWSRRTGVQSAPTARAVSKKSAPSVRNHHYLSHTPPRIPTPRHHPWQATDPRCPRAILDTTWTFAKTHRTPTQPPPSAEPRGGGEALERPLGGTQLGGHLELRPALRVHLGRLVEHMGRGLARDALEEGGGDARL